MTCRFIASSTASWRRPATVSTATAPAVPKHPDIKAEFSKVPFDRGIVGMARKGHSNDSANSQFFIMFDEGHFLNNQYTVIGEVVEGMDIVDKLKRGEPPRDPDKIIRMQVAADAK